MTITELNDHGFHVLSGRVFRFTVLTDSIQNLINPLLDPEMKHEEAKISDMLKFDSVDGAPLESQSMEAVIINPYGMDDTPNIKKRARSYGWQTASLRELVSWFKASQFLHDTVLALGPNPEGEEREYSYDAVCGNAAPMFNYGTSGKLDVCVDPVWVDWPSWANFLLVRSIDE